MYENFRLIHPGDHRETGGWTYFLPGTISCPDPVMTAGSRLAIKINELQAGPQQRKRKKYFNLKVMDNNQ
jgi:hypothetical protein